MAEAVERQRRGTGNGGAQADGCSTPQAVCFSHAAQAFMAKTRLSGLPDHEVGPPCSVGKPVPHGHHAGDPGSSGTHHRPRAFESFGCDDFLFEALLRGRLSDRQVVKRSHARHGRD